MILERVAEVDSTQAVLKARAASGGGEVALRAGRQSAGQGRMGRTWQTVDGNLHLSVLLRPGALRWPGHWSLLSAVALVDAVRAAWDGPGALRLKWPNDVLLDGGKLAGILLDAGASPEPWLVIGFGVNLAAGPEGLGRKVASLGGAVTPEAFAGLLLAAMQRWRGRYGAEGFGPVRAAWLAAGHAPGEAIVAGATAGRFLGLRDDGALLLEGPDGTVAVVAGEVS